MPANASIMTISNDTSYPAEPAGPEPVGSKDLLCRQYHNGPRIDYDLLHLCTDSGKELLGYIPEQDPLT
jgi:hypothetical protein